MNSGVKKKRLCGRNLLLNCQTRQKQMEYLLENMKEPDFSLIDENIFDDVNTKDFNPAGITWRILNHNLVGQGHNKSSSYPTWTSVARFMASIQDYLPKNLRTKQNPTRLWSRGSFPQTEDTNVAEYTQELLNEMCEWLANFKSKIEDHISSKYFRFGKNQFLETLKRRYKETWGDRIEQSIDANVTDRTIDVKFEQL